MLVSQVDPRPPESRHPPRSGQRGPNERGRRRREQLLEAVADHILTHGVVGFSLRSAAAAAGTTHRMLRYHFGSAPELIREALSLLRARRVERAVDPREAESGLSDLTAGWQMLMRDEASARVLLEGIGLALAQPDQFGAIGLDSVREYLPPIEASLPQEWSQARRRRAATLVLGVIRGLMLDAFSTGEQARVQEALESFEELILAAGWIQRH